MNITAQEHSVVGVYASHTDAEAAIKALKTGGFDMKQLSIVGKSFHTEEHAVGFYTKGDRMMFWGGQGAFWGSLWGMLFGSALFFLPGVGPIVAMGPVVAMIAGALEGAVLGGSAGVFGGALAGLGIADDQVMRFETEIKAGKFLVFARGSAGEIERAHGILGTTGASHLSAKSI